MRSSTIVIPQRCVNFFATCLYSSGIAWVLLSSIQHGISIKSGSAAVSLISVSRSSLKSISADLMLSSCRRFLGAFVSMTLFIRTYCTAISSIGPSRYFCTGIAGLVPGSSVTIGSSGVEEIVDSVSGADFWILIASGLFSVVVPCVCGSSSPKSLK